MYLIFCSNFFEKELFLIYLHIHGTVFFSICSLDHFEDNLNEKLGGKAEVLFKLSTVTET